ncbi:hypothetical protein [Burkholderia multivorans]|uniref:hypothetical protein n=1 Tax=Burkholderia multivorans TaxID=87883 RepID=UPI0028580CF6|nr:hypothetical protein [Burkholderia multivorans]MDR9096148.1 hypothetical protein [Burkholderia multivorans]MDR9119921.1 hypothetical protein [Burkholderia multivorans]MDR9160188.1 hypothetical protein [Burkholderia multivorans]MDR9166745.1 hypothetical protein [Burkholderia multivorans]MDR9253224.1 hypothetical protein [Burkholderia multivorans]
MGIEYKKTIACLIDHIPVEEAEGLLEWLQGQKKPKVDLSACTHMHAAVLQVLMAARPVIAAWPEDADLSAWLRGALEHQPD